MKTSARITKRKNGNEHFAPRKEGSLRLFQGFDFSFSNIGGKKLSTSSRVSSRGRGKGQTDIFMREEGKERLMSKPEVEPPG